MPDEKLVSTHQISWDLQNFLCTYVDKIALRYQLERETYGIVNDYMCTNPDTSMQRIPPLDGTPWPEGIVLFHGAFCTPTQEAFNMVLRETVARLRCHPKNGNIDILVVIDSYGGEISCLDAMLEQINGLRREHKNLRISTYGLRNGCSCGFALYMTGINRYLSEFFKGLHHQPWMQQPEKKVTADATDITDDLSRKKEEMDEMIEGFLFRGHLQCTEGSGMLGMLEKESKKHPSEPIKNGENADVLSVKILLRKVREKYKTYRENANKKEGGEETDWPEIRSLMRRLWYTYVYNYASPRFKEKSQAVILNMDLEKRGERNVLVAMIKDMGENENDLWLERDDMIGFGLVNSTTAGECDTFTVTTETKTVHKPANVKKMNVI